MSTLTAGFSGARGSVQSPCRHARQPSSGPASSRAFSQGTSPLPVSKDRLVSPHPGLDMSGCAKPLRCATTPSPLGCVSHAKAKPPSRLRTLRQGLLRNQCKSARVARGSLVLTSLNSMYSALSSSERACGWMSPSTICNGDDDDCVIVVVHLLPPRAAPPSLSFSLSSQHKDKRTSPSPERRKMWFEHARSLQ